MNWMDILKTQETILDVGFDFDLPEEEPSEEDRDCCQEAKEEYIAAFAGTVFDDDTGKWIKPSSTYWDKDYGSEIRDIFRKETERFIKHIREEDCDRLKYEMNLNLKWPRPAAQRIEENRITKEILDNWEECENE